MRRTPSINLCETDNREQLNSLLERLQVLNSHTNQTSSVFSLLSLLPPAAHHPQPSTPIGKRTFFLLRVIWCVFVCRGRVRTGSMVEQPCFEYQCCPCWGAHTVSTQTHGTYSVNKRQGHNYGPFHTTEAKDTFILCDVPKMVIICSNAKGRRERDKNSGAE